MDPDPKRYHLGFTEHCISLSQAVLNSDCAIERHAFYETRLEHTYTMHEYVSVRIYQEVLHLLYRQCDCIQSLDLSIRACDLRRLRGMDGTYIL